MRKIIIDTDPGIDDAAAIAIAMFSPELDVQLITTVSGNVSVEKTTHNALRLMTLWNAGVPVAAGASRSLTGMQYDAGDTHGESGMDGFAFDEVTVQPVKLHAVEAMRRVLERSEEKVTLVPIGPLTNLALLPISKGGEGNRRKAGQEINFHHSSIHDDKYYNGEGVHGNLYDNGLQKQPQ